MTKTQQILEYHTKHPGAPQRDIVAATGMSRQFVSATLRHHKIKVPRVRRESGRLCTFCGEEVISWRWLGRGRGSVRSAYHKSCSRKHRYQGVCPVCGKSFSRRSGQTRRTHNGRPTTGVVCCSNRCRMQVPKLGLYAKARAGQGGRNS